MRRFSVIKIICCLSIITLGVFNIYLMFRFGFNYWLKWMLVLPITDLFWILAMVNFLIVVIGLMTWSRIEAVYIAYTPVAVIGLYILFVIVTKAAHMRGPFLPFGAIHIFFLAVSIVGTPFAILAINDELKYEWNTSILGVLGAPVRLIDRLLGPGRRQPQREEPPARAEDWTALRGERQQPEPQPEQPPEARPGHPAKKWYDELVDMQRKRFQRK